MILQSPKKLPKMNFKQDQANVSLVKRRTSVWACVVNVGSNITIISSRGIDKKIKKRLEKV